MHISYIGANIQPNVNETAANVDLDPHKWHFVCSHGCTEEESLSTS